MKKLLQTLCALVLLAVVGNTVSAAKQGGQFYHQNRLALALDDSNFDSAQENDDAKEDLGVVSPASSRLAPSPLGGFMSSEDLIKLGLTEHMTVEVWNAYVETLTAAGLLKLADTDRASLTAEELLKIKKNSPGREYGCFSPSENAKMRQVAARAAYAIVKAHLAS